MKAVTCNDLGGPCDFTAKGSDDEVKQQLLAHGLQAHPEMMTGLSEADKQMLENKLAQILAEQN
jgi:predicted small metal-binding protein